MNPKAKVTHEIEFGLALKSSGQLGAFYTL